MAHTANPFDHSGTLDTSAYDWAVQTEAFGATGPAGDAGQPTAGARTVVTPQSVADICAATDQDAVINTVQNNRAAWLTEVTPYAIRQSVVQ